MKTTQPNFIYQLQFQSGEIEKRIRTTDEIKQFLIALYEGTTDDGRVGFTSRGVLFENLKDLKPSDLLTPAVRVTLLPLLVEQLKPETDSPD